MVAPSVTAALKEAAHQIQLAVPARFRPSAEAWEGTWVRTCERFADGMAELLSGYEMDSEVNVHFDSSTAMTWLVDIPFTGVCEHHLMPFYGRAHVFLTPGKTGRVPGKSKYARVIEKHARRLTLEERIADDAANELYASDAKPRGVMVKLDGVVHTCVCSRGVRAQGAVGGSCAIRGNFRDRTVRMEALAHLDVPRRV